MVYKFKSGAQIRADAQVAGEMCERLASEGRLTARNLVDENRPETAPLHGAFEWNNDTAAECWREHQARHIIASLTIQTEQAEPIRAFFNIVRADPQYSHIESILQEKDDTENLLKMALAELVSIQKKYFMLHKLAKVFEAIDEAREGTSA